MRKRYPKKKLSKIVCKVTPLKKGNNKSYRITCKSRAINKRDCKDISNIVVKKILQTVRVKGHRFDIRSLQAKRDSIQIFGFDGKNVKPVRTDFRGRVEVVQPRPFPSRVFHEEKFLNVTTHDDWIVIKPQNTATQVTYSYAIVNKGNYPAIVRVEVSPNSIDFAIDREDDVNPHTTLVMVPTRFLRYTRVSVRSKQPVNQTTLDIYFQSQSIG
jgi:hypothetical protein